MENQTNYIETIKNKKIDMKQCKKMMRKKFSDIIKENMKKENIANILTKLNDFINIDVIDIIKNNSVELKKKGAKKKYTDAQLKEKKNMLNHLEKNKEKRRQYLKKYRMNKKMKKID